MARVILDGVHDPAVRPDWTPVKPDFDTIPEALRGLPWAVFVLEPRPNGKWGKAPRNAQGFPVSRHAPEKWLTPEECKRHVEAGLFDGAGSYLDGSTDLIGLDFDHIRDQPKEIRRLVDQARKDGLFVGVTVSGTGVRIFCRGQMEATGHNGDGVEIYRDLRFISYPKGQGEIREAQWLVDAVLGHIGKGKAREEKQGQDKAHAGPDTGAKVTDDLLAKIEAATREALGEATDRFIPKETNEDGIELGGYAGRSEQIFHLTRVIATKALEAGLTDRATLEGVVHEVGNRQPVVHAWTDAGGSKWERDTARLPTIRNAITEALKGWKGAKAPQVGEIGIHGDQGDIINAKRFAAKARGKLIRVHETGDILQYGSDIGHVQAEPNAEYRQAEAVIDDYKGLAATLIREHQPDDPKVKRLLAHISRSSTLPKMRAMIDLGFAQPGMTRRLSEFDADPYNLGCVNGRLDVKRGTLLPFTEDCPITKRIRAAFDPFATAPTWEAFLERVLPDETVRGYMQRFFSMCLVGEVTEHIFLFMYGTGANGKSVFVETMNWLLGDYSIRIPTEMLMRHQRSPQAASPDIVAMKGKRLAFANETTEGSFLDEARVKEMVSNDTMTGRVPYAKEPVSFPPSHKLVIVGNHHPNISDNGDGIWRRQSLVPFEVTIPREEQDPHLLTKLKAESAGILNWLLDGYREYRSIGLAIPPRIMAETAAYREEQDLLLDFLRECEFITLQPGEVSQKAAAYRLYTEWAKGSGLKPMSAKSFTRRIRAHGVRMDAGRRHYVGLRCGNPQPGGGVAAA